MDYLDFNLRIGPPIAKRQYPVSAKAPTGEATDIFIWNGAYQPRSANWRAVTDFGEKTFLALFKNQILVLYSTSYSEAQRQGKGLRVNLTLIPQLANFAWEFLHNPSHGQFLCLFKDTPIIRYTELLTPAPSLTVTEPLRILAVQANPRDYDSLDITHEQQSLSQTLKGLLTTRLIEVTWLPHATLDALREQLGKREEEYHIFHFIGHGRFDRGKKEGVLIFENERQGSDPVSANKLAVILGNHPTLRLATLNTCESAHTSAKNPFAGTAMTLVRTGKLPAVVAMQARITDSAAIAFAQGFYAAIAQADPVEAAVTRGRQAIMSQINSVVEWGTPVLYSRAKDGIIFQLSEERKHQISKDIEQSNTAWNSGQFNKAKVLSKETVTVEKDYFKAALSGTTEDEPNGLANFAENQIKDNSKVDSSQISCVTDFVRPALRSKHLFIVGEKGDGKTFLNRQIEYWARSIDRQWIVVNWKKFIPLFEERQNSLSAIVKSLGQDLCATLKYEKRFDGAPSLRFWDDASDWREQFLPLKKMLREKDIEGVFISIDDLDKYPEFSDNKQFEFLVSCVLRPQITTEPPRFYLRLFMEKTTHQNLNTTSKLWNDFETINLDWTNLQKQEILRARNNAIQRSEGPAIPEIELAGMVKNAKTARDAILQLKKYYETEILKESMVMAEWSP